MIKAKVIVPNSPRQKEFMDRIINGIKRQQQKTTAMQCSANYQIVGNDTIIYEFDSVAITPITSFLGANKLAFGQFKRQCHELSPDIKVEKIK